ncbi:hypothetical protein [Olleya sp. R77988]|uniref:hypothetical protein n=1 Tax=Olleya sp. R77988 TaxID=3093875 RepID=UPI0037C874B4
MKLSFWVLATLFLVSCNNENKEDVKEKIVYDMYVPSEMSILMQEMYDYNLQLKKDIVEGKTPTEFPNDFLNIHSAQLSNFKKRNERFKSFSNVFINAEKEIFNDQSTLSLKERFNNTINVCVSCHQKECTGPIPKIKKLLIANNN